MLKKLIGFALLYALGNTPLGGVKFQESIFLRNNPLQQIEEKVEECYAKEVVRPGTNLVVNNYSALGKPDGEYTWVLPHGEITLKMSRPLYSLGFYIDGRVVAKEGLCIPSGMLEHRYTE